MLLRTEPCCSRKEPCAIKMRTKPLCSRTILLSWSRTRQQYNSRTEPCCSRRKLVKNTNLIQTFCSRTVQFFLIPHYASENRTNVFCNRTRQEYNSRTEMCTMEFITDP